MTTEVEARPPLLSLPVLRGERVGVRGTLHESNLREKPLTPPCPREGRGEGEEAAAATYPIQLNLIMPLADLIGLLEPMHAA
jgi:hypothetical protein